MELMEWLIELRTSLVAQAVVDAAVGRRKGAVVDTELRHLKTARFQRGHELLRYLPGASPEECLCKSVFQAHPQVCPHKNVF